jgi:hypothetical protein
VQHRVDTSAAFPCQSCLELPAAASRAQRGAALTALLSAVSRAERGPVPGASTRATILASPSAAAVLHDTRDGPPFQHSRFPWRRHAQFNTHAFGCRRSVTASRARPRGAPLTDRCRNGYPLVSAPHAQGRVHFFCSQRSVTLTRPAAQRSATDVSSISTVSMSAHIARRAGHVERANVRGRSLRFS